MKNRQGLLIILSSPSGAGKSTLARKLREWDPSITFSVSATTRKPRPGEVDGEDYHFVEEPKFKRLVAENEMLEHAHVFGNFYGSPKAAILETINSGKDVLFDIDWQGAQQIRNSSLSLNTLTIFLLPPSIIELRNRLLSRGQDTEETVARRMEKSWDEISHWGSYDFVLINGDLALTEERLRSIITASRLRRTQQAGLTEHVRALHTQFEEIS
jgi:guanylate kinase